MSGSQRNLFHFTLGKISWKVIFCQNKVVFLLVKMGNNFTWQSVIKMTPWILESYWIPDTSKYYNVYLSPQFYFWLLHLLLLDKFIFVHYEKVLLKHPFFKWMPLLDIGKKWNLNDCDTYMLDLAPEYFSSLFILKIAGLYNRPL